MVFFCLSFSIGAVSRLPDDWVYKSFPELRTRAHWDQGCEDWPLQTGREERNVSLKTFKQAGFVRVQASIRLPSEPGESVKELRKQVIEILSNAQNYDKWVLPGVNESSLGDTYFVRLLNLLGGPVRSEFRHAYVLGAYEFELLWMKRDGKARVDFLFLPDTLPNCPSFAEVKGSAEHVFYRMAPRLRMLDMMALDLWVLPVSEESRELNLRLSLRAKPAELVYQLIPERLLVSQVEQRARRIFENFVDFRRRSYVQTHATSRSLVPSSK